MLEIKIMTEGDFDFAVAMTEREQWFHERRDFLRLTRFEPQGCFIAWENDVRAGMICSTSQPEYAFLSCLIVTEASRNRNIGEALMRRAIDFQLSRGDKTLELDGVIPALPLYRRLGFRDKYLSLRLWRPPDSRTPVVPVCPGLVPPETILHYDHLRTGLQRGHILSRFYEEFHESLFTAPGDPIGGYAFVRSRANGINVIGPLVADSPADAEMILASIIGAIGNKKLGMGIPEIKREGVALAIRHGFLYGQPSLRMYMGKRRDYESSVFAILSPEKG